MGRTFKRNDRWKKDRRDKNFRKSKKFKDNQHGHQHTSRPNIEPQIEEDSYDSTGDNS